MKAELFGKSFSFHGYTPTDAEARALQAGNCPVLDNFGDKLDYLVVIDPASTAGRLNRARALKIPVLTVPRFKQLIA